jgi:glutamate formiminotransferase / formiminotetrahydrofolate cyclodeaminase
VTLFECVPNFSEGRDASIIARISDAARSVPHVTVLDTESNADHHRCVISLAGEGADLVEAVFQMMRVATELIDLTHHHGEHPRMGATDVVPFVPLGDASMDQAVALARQLGARVARELRIPVYLYGMAAQRPERADLAHVREGQFEGIRDSIASDPGRAPDFGEPRVHPTAGAVAIGARPVLIAYNAYLSTPEVAIAKKIAKAIRARDGGLVEVKALGFEIQERQRAQVSMNLTDYRRTSVPRALEFVRREAARFGVTIEESEVVGLIPEDALFDAAEYYLQLHRFDRDSVLERKVRSVATAGAGGMAAESLREFVDRIAARTPTPGGGSAAAAAGALGAALGEMVLLYSIPTGGSDPVLGPVLTSVRDARARFLDLIGEDSAAYEGVRSARRDRKERPHDAVASKVWVVALRKASEVPLETARIARHVSDGLGSVRDRTKAALGSDLVTSLALLRAAREGALANVVINLDDLRAAHEPVDDLEAEIARLSAPGS